MSTPDATTLNSLAALLDAGLAPASAFVRLAEQTGESASRWQTAQTALQQGSTTAEALGKARLLSSSETLVLHSAETVGRLVETLRQLAQQRNARTLRLRRLRSQLILPLIILLIGIGAALVLAAARGNLTPVLAEAAWAVCQFGGLTLLMLYVLATERLTWLDLGWRLVLPRWMTAYLSLFEQEFLGGLMTQTDAGLDAASALKNLARLLRSDDYRQRVSNAARLTEGGEDLVTALVQSGLPLRSATQRIMTSGIAAGRLEVGLQHHLKLGAERIELHVDTIHEWLPRAWYLLALVLVSPLF